MIESFLKHLQFEKRLSGNTILAYQNDLLQLRQFLQETFSHDDPSLANYTMVRAWVVHLVESGLEPSSVNRKIACLRRFFKFLMAEGVIADDPMFKISVLKTKKRLAHFVREDDMVNLLDKKIPRVKQDKPAQEEPVIPETFAFWRDQLLLELFYCTGIRLSELINLKDRSINFRERTIKVLGKRNRERVIPFPAPLVLTIKKYQTLRNKEVGMKDHGNLFVTESGDPCYPMLIYRTVKKYLSDFTSVEKRSPHVLRHTYATHLLDKGADLNAVKDLLGHASLAATQVYTHNSMEKLKKVFDQAHPKA